MTLYTIGFTQKSAEEFFGKLREHDVKLVIDVRLNNRSQLAGFTKGRDLAFFLKELCRCRYVHEERFAPTKDILNPYKKGEIDWEEYVNRFDRLMERRRLTEIFRKEYLKTDRCLLLCSEPTPEQCHRRLLAEKFAQELDVDVVHL